MPRAGLPSPDFTLGLARTVVLASETPMLLLGDDTTVLTASRSFCESFGVDPVQAVLAPLASLGHGEWDVPQLDGLILATASGFAAVKDYEMELRWEGRPAQCLLISAQRLNYPSEMGALVLLSATDVTEARRRDRQNDSLVQQKAVLLQELQHRVANSLQIIASVLLQSARRVQSDEARSSIKDAHHRMMSVAALQHQLAASHLDEVDLGLYLVSLCRSIGASMIHDPSKLAVEVNVARDFVKADVSLSLGLIVTELVINALKHAYPAGQGGTILVGYTSLRDGWTLTVSDDGVGMGGKSTEARAGLGSSIVTALAAQLGATIVVSTARPATARPGTVVSIRHEADNKAGTRPVLAVV
jgi:two-component sensor histidine kinase